MFEYISTINKDSLASAIVGRKLKQVKTIKTSDIPWSLKWIDGELRCWQNDGVSVYDTRLTTVRRIVRRIDTGCALNVVRLPGENVVIAGSALCEMSKSGIDNYSFKTFQMVQ